MQTKAYTTIDKSEWPRGPWDHEPDKVQWQDEATGLPCLIVRSNATGGLCGYAGVPDSHPWHGTTNEAIDSRIEVHGGLTFAGECQDADEAHGICHMPGPGEPDNVWWFGFDCGHCFDLSPGYQARISKFIPERERAMQDEVYRDLAYVRAEVTQLAAQLAAVHA